MRHALGSAGSLTSRRQGARSEHLTTIARACAARALVLDRAADGPELQVRFPCVELQVRFPCTRLHLLYALAQRAGVRTGLVGMRTELSFTALAFRQATLLSVLPATAALRNTGAEEAQRAINGILPAVEWFRKVCGTRAVAPLHGLARPLQSILGSQTTPRQSIHPQELGGLERSRLHAGAWADAARSSSLPRRLQEFAVLPPELQPPAASRLRPEEELEQQVCHLPLPTAFHGPPMDNTGRSWLSSPSRLARAQPR
jgi:hypothetical protein